MSELTVSETNVKKMAEDHWAWVGKLLSHAKLDEDNLSLIGVVYVTAFCHGWKHRDKDSAKLSHAKLDEDNLSLIGFVYVTAFRHGWKHCDKDSTKSYRINEEGQKGGHSSSS